MLAYDINKKIIYDICKKSVMDVNNKLLRVYFENNVDEVIKQNPMIILRAIKYIIRYGFEVQAELETSMLKNKDLLFDGRYANERLVIGFCELFEEGREKAEKLISKYGLEKIYTFKTESPNANSN